MTLFAVEFHRDAQSDLRTIAVHYEKLAVELGFEFIQSVNAVLHRIRRSFRRAVVHRFPFGVVNLVNLASVRVIAV